MKKNYQKLLTLMIIVSMSGLFSHTLGIAFGATPKYIFGTLQNTPSHLLENYDAGMRVAVLELAWDAYFPTEGAKNMTYVNDMLDLIQTYKSHGFDIMLDLGLQYAPDWVFNYANSRFVNQFGDSFTGGPGEKIVNAVFNNVMRQKQEAYVQQVFTDLGTDFACVKIGWLRYGELGYPESNYNGKSNTYWAYDSIARFGGPDLPAGMYSSPFPGWKPGEPTANHFKARKFYKWYIESLANYQNWMISSTRNYYQGELCVLYPSWGTRPGTVDAAVNVDLDGSTSQEINGEIQRGHDFQTLIATISDPNVMVYCTWIDSKEAWSNDGSSNPGDWSPVHWLSVLAQTHSPVLSVGGENTGWADLTKLDLTFRRLEAFNLKLLMWAFEPQLYGGTYVNVNQYGNYISAYQEYSGEAIPSANSAIPGNNSSLKSAASVEAFGKTDLRLQAYPNPFNSDTQIHYQLPVSGDVTLRIYDNTGREIEILHEGLKNEGTYSIAFEESAFKRGISFVQLLMIPTDSGKPLTETITIMKVYGD